VPLPDGLRARAKPFLDTVGQRGGQALASLYLLAELALNRGDAVTAAAAAALCGIWIVWTSDLRRHYLDLFRTALKEGVVQARADMPALDLGSLEALFASLNSRDDGEVLAAMDLLVEQGRVRLVPALILYHPSSVVVRRALQHFARAGRADFLPIADRLATHGDPEVRAAALRARTAVQGDVALLRRSVEDESPLVSATALAGLIALGEATMEDRLTLRAMFEGGSAETRLAVARVIREEPSRAFVDALLRLVEVQDFEVQVLVAEAMGRIGDDRFLPALLPLLAQRQTRHAAREAFLTYGDGGLAFLDEALRDPSLPQELRRHLPRTLSLFEPRAAARALERHLLAEPDGMVRFKILRALNRLATHPEVELDGVTLERAITTTLEAGLRLLDWRLAFLRGARADQKRRTRGHELLVTLLQDKEVHTVERLFRLLSLRHRGEDMKGIYRGLSSTNAKVRAGGRELLENLLEPPLREGVLALVDDGPPEQRLRRAAPFYPPRPLDYEELLGRILAGPSESLRCLAAYHVAELGLTTFRPRLEALRTAQTGFFLTRVVERALALLSPEGGRLLHA
jgi:HEAT repeat protein